MGKCLVTQLTEAVNDETLLKVRELAFLFKKSSNAGVTGLFMNVNATTTFRIVGEGYFTESDGSGNLGSTITKTIGEGVLEMSVSLYLTSNVSMVVIDDKNKITQLGSTTTSKNLVQNPQGGSNNTALIIVNDLTDFMYATRVNYLAVAADTITGDIVGLSKMTGLSAIFAASLTQIYGDLSSLKNLTAMKTLAITSSLIEGNIKSLAGMVNLTSLTMRCRNVIGDISSLSGITKANQMDFKNVNGLYGDLSKLNNNVRFFSNSGGTSGFSWQTGATNTNMLILEACKIVEGADQYLIDQAERNFNPPSSAIWFAKISITANITSASDAAIATLQSKGVTVVVTPLN